MKTFKDFILLIVAIFFCYVGMCVFGGCSQLTSSADFMYATGHVSVYGTSPHNEIGFKTDDGQNLFFNDADYMQDEQGKHLRIHYTLSGTEYLGQQYIDLVSWEIIK